MTEANSFTETAEQWAIAKKYAALYGNLPGSFTSLIRSLRNDTERNQRSYSFSSQYQLRRLLRGDSFRSPFYYAARSYRRKALAELGDLDADKLIGLFYPDEFAALLAVLYLYRRSRKLCVAAEWQFLVDGYQSRCDVAALVGGAMPAVGLAHAILVEAIPAMSIATFLMNDEKGYREYRRQLKLAHQSRDINYELQRWGCCHAQIGANLLINFGFGGDSVQGLKEGWLLEGQPDENMDKLKYATAVTKLWVDSLINEAQEPQIRHSAAYYPDRAALEELLARAKALAEDNSREAWLDRNKEDISPDKTPELFAHSDAAMTAPEPIPVDDEDESSVDQLIEEIS